jgi:hypothetical protein
VVDLATAGLKEGKKTPREGFLTLPVSDPLNDVESGKNLVSLSSQFAELQIQVPETQSAFHPHAQRNAFHHRGMRRQ